MARSAHAGHTAALGILCEAVVDARGSPHEPDQHGWTPLHRAAYAGHLEAVKILLSFKPIPPSTAKAGAGCSPESKLLARRPEAQEFGQHSSMQEALEGVLVTPLHVARTRSIRKELELAGY